MNSRNNYLDADNSIMERNLRFVKNDFQDNLNQFFGGSGGSRGNNASNSAPPRDYKVIQPKSGDFLSALSPLGLNERKEFLRQIGLSRHEAYDLAKETNFDVEYYREKRHEWRKNGQTQTQVDKRLLGEIKSRNLIFPDSVYDNNNTKISLNVPPPPPIISKLQITERTQTQVDKRLLGEIKSRNLSFPDSIYDNNNTKISLNVPPPPPPIISKLQITERNTTTNIEVTSKYGVVDSTKYNIQESSKTSEIIEIIDSDGEETEKFSYKGNVNKSRHNNKFEEPKDIPYVKLSSGEKRLFKKALNKGLSREMALKRATFLRSKHKHSVEKRKSELNDKVSTYKRPLLDKKLMPFISKEQTNTNLFKTLNTTSSITSFKEDIYQAPKDIISTTLQRRTNQPMMISSDKIKIGIIPYDYINNPLSMGQMLILKESIIDTAIEWGSDAKPEFNGCSILAGWILVNCANRTTADWLKRNINIIMKRSNCEVIAIEDESMFPRTHIITGYFPQSQDMSNKKIFATIGTQNDLNTSNWKVQLKKLEDSRIYLVIEIDDISWKKLCKLNGRIAYRFGHLNLTLMDDKKEQMVQAFQTDADGIEENFLISSMDEGPSTSRFAIDQSLRRPTRNIRSTPNDSRH